MTRPRPCCSHSEDSHSSGLHLAIETTPCPTSRQARGEEQEEAPWAPGSCLPSAALLPRMEMMGRPCCAAGASAQTFRVGKAGVLQLPAPLKRADAFVLFLRQGPHFLACESQARGSQATAAVQEPLWELAGAAGSWHRLTPRGVDRGGLQRS